MKKQLLPFEIYVRNRLRKEKDVRDELLLKKMLMEKKKKHDEEKEAEIQELKKRLEKLQEGRIEI